MKVRLVLLAASLAAMVALIAGCGGGDDGGGSADPAALAPAGSPVYVQASLRPEGEVASNINALAKNLAGIDDVGDAVISALEESAVAEGDEFDYDKEIAPWLGEDAGIYLHEYDGEDFLGYGVAIATTDSDAAQEFIDEQSKDESPTEGSYEGVDFKVEEDDETAVGIIDDFLVIAENEDSFKEMVDAADGENLAEQDSFGEAFDAVSDGSLVDVYADIGGIVKESGGQIDSETQQFLELAGIDPDEATAVASLVPGSDQIEIDFSSDVFDAESSGDASALLEAMPGGSFFAAAVPDVGESLGEAIDELDENGIPGQIEPGELKSAMKQEGIDLEAIGKTVGDVAFFAQGNTENNLTGAAVIEATNADEATNTVSNLGLLLRTSGTPGVTAYKEGGATGFSIRSDELGQQPLIVAAKDDKIAISYGLAAATQALTAGSGATLGQNPEFEAAKEALGDVPISAFVNGPAALALIESTSAAEDQAELEEVKPYLDKVSYLAIGSGSSGDRVSSKLILGFDE